MKRGCLGAQNNVSGNIQLQLGTGCHVHTYHAGSNRFAQLYDTQGAASSMALPAANSATPFSSGFSSYVKVHTEWAANLGTWHSSSHDSHCCVLFWDFPRQCLGVAGDVCAL